MIETGVNLTLNDNASAAARRAADALEQVAGAADEVNSALDPRTLDAYNQKLTEIGEAYTKLDKGMKLRDQYQAQNVRQMTNMIQSVGGGIVQAGRGDVAGGMLTGVKSLAGMAGKILGPVAAVAGLAIGGSKLADIYGERAVPAQRIAALEGAMGTDIEANTIALMDAMKSTKDSVAKYGKTFEEGARARETFLRAGGTNFAGSGAAAYSLAMAADFGGLAAFTGMGQRYGQTGGLDVVNALMSAQGLGPGQFEEVMGGIQGTFTEALSRGITRSMEDIGISQEYFGRIGPAWQGALGAQRLQGMNQTVAGAAGLQQQSDLFLYRAAAGITPGGDIIEIKKRMERGLTPELFQGLMGEFGRIGYGRTESILQLSKMFGLSTEASEALYGLGMGGEVSKEQLSEALIAGQGATVTTGYIGNIEDVKQWVAELGAGIYDLRADAIDGTIEGFKDLVLAGDKLSTTFEDVAETIKEIFTIEEDERYTGLRSSISQASAIPHRDKIIRTLAEAEAAGVPFENLEVPKFFGFRKYITGGEELIAAIEKLIEATDRTTEAVNGETILQDDRGATPATDLGAPAGSWAAGLPK